MGTVSLTKKAEASRPDHEVHEPLGGGPGSWQGGHVLAVLEDGDTVGDAQDLLEVVRDVDDAQAAFGEPADERQEVLRLSLPQRRGRLVEDEDIGREAQGAHDHRQLPLGGREPGPELVRVEIDAQVLDDGLRDAALLARVHDVDGPHRLLAQEDVVSHGQAGDDVRLLVDGADAELPGPSAA